MSLPETLTSIEEAIQALSSISAQQYEDYLGKQGSLSLLMKSLSSCTPQERKEYGQRANMVRKQIESLKEAPANVTPDPIIDWTVPAAQRSQGTIHPVSAMMKRMTDIFEELSFEVVEGNEIVTDYDNFEVLNLGKDHPARDGHDSFYLDQHRLLRTQTTALDVAEMGKRFKAGEMPIRIVLPGKTYRRESDQTHSLMFHQIDAIMVDTQTTFADLKGSLDYFAKRLFGDSVETRFRPHHFPFTEPSAELDIRWKGVAHNEGKHTGWLEMGGCGMLHPEVLKHAGINPKIYQGWAFGMSIERPIMIINQIPDLRIFFENSLDFLNQFTSQV